MLYLTVHEAEIWNELSLNAKAGSLPPDTPLSKLRPPLRPALRFHIAASLAKSGNTASALEWLSVGALEEGENMGCAYLAGFLRRHGTLSMPATVFEDPRPYIHFTTVPAIQNMRRKFREFAARTLPQYNRPVRFMDVGCGNGSMGLELLLYLREQGVVPDIEEIVLVDPFPAMLEISAASAREAFPGATVTLILGKAQDIAAALPHLVDITLCSLSIHHLPWEVKCGLAEKLAERSAELLLFEMNSDHDTPELGSPGLSLSVYQGYGGIIDAIFAHDAPLEIALRCVDLFLLAEVVSLLTEPRGVRTEYHLTAMQWQSLFEQKTGYRLAAGETCLANCGVEFYGQHYR